MEPLQTLSDFYMLAITDSRISATHIAVYAAFIYLWTAQKQTPIFITREKIMKLAKIKGIATYQKCIRDLHICKYISYQPSFHPHGKSLIYFNNFLESEREKGIFVQEEKVLKP